MATHQDCIHSRLCAFRKDLCVTENLKNVKKECPFFEEKKEVRKMKCEDCVYYGEPRTEQPCCGCVNFVNFECYPLTEEGDK